MVVALIVGHAEAYPVPSTSRLEQISVAFLSLLRLLSVPEVP